MSMTKEEAIKYAESKKIMLEALIFREDCAYGNHAMYSTELSFVNAALSALRPITREQAKETKAVFFQPGVEDVAQDSYRCSHCYVQEFGDTRGINFCPHCGAPMTDEAVEILVKRMEEMRND